MCIRQEQIQAQTKHEALLWFDTLCGWHWLQIDNTHAHNLYTQNKLNIRTRSDDTHHTYAHTRTHAWAAYVRVLVCVKFPLCLSVSLYVCRWKWYVERQRVDSFLTYRNIETNRKKITNTSTTHTWTKTNEKKTEPRDQPIAQKNEEKTVHD